MSSPLVKIDQSSAERKDLSSDTQIRVTGSIEHEICTEMIRNWSEKLGAKFHSTTLDYSLLRISCLDYASAEIHQLEASQVEGKQLQQKDKERRKTKGEKNKKIIILIKKPKDLGHFLVQKPNFWFLLLPKQQYYDKFKSNASGKKDMLSCCKCFFE